MSPFVYLVIVLAAAAAVVVLLRTRHRVSTPAPQGAPAPMDSDMEQVIPLLAAAGFDPGTAKVRRDPAAAPGLQWRVRARTAGEWRFGAGATAADAVADLAATDGPEALASAS